MKNHLIITLLLCTCLLSQRSTAAGHAADQPGQQLVGALWRATSAEQKQLAITQLLDGAPDTHTLYQWLRAGPAWSDTAARGQLELQREGADGLQFPYVVLVPESYTPDKPIAVEFNLHGGVNRAKVASGVVWWRQGYDRLRDPDRIVVLPASWNESFWWFSNQAQNLPAILRSIKQSYNIDENQVYLTGVSDGGTGAYFFAFFQPTEWAAFLPYIGNPGVLQNPNGRVSYPLFFENLSGKPLYIVTGENDRLYPARAIKPHIDAMVEAGVEHTWVVIAGGGHNTEWLPDEAANIAAFKQNNVRDPLPEKLRWTANRTDVYNRNHWIRIDERGQRGEPGRLTVQRAGNTIEVDARAVAAFTLLLSPEEIDFSQPVSVRVNGKVIHQALVSQSSQTLLKWAALDLDRSMLFTAELNLRSGE